MHEGYAHPNAFRNYYIKNLFFTYSRTALSSFYHVSTPQIVDAKATMSEHPSTQEHAVTEHPSTQEHATMTEHLSTIQDTTTHPSTSNIQESHRLLRSSDQGYIVVLEMWEQLMGGSQNFQQLMCWAKCLQGVTAVEPSTGFHSNSSSWGFSFGNRSINFPMLSDVFNMSSYEKHYHVRWGALSTVTSQEKFIWGIKNFQMNAILVQLEYGRSSQKRCNFTWNISDLMNDLDPYPLLKITRKVCINVNPIKSGELKDLVLGDNEVQNAVIIMRDWRGIGPGRVNIKSTVCSTVPRYGLLRPSAQVLEDAETYADKYLGGFGQYISVTARFEKVPKFYYKISQEEKRQAVLLAINNAMLKVDSLKEMGHVDRVYLSYDYGKFGSRTFKNKYFYNASEVLVKFQQDLYDGSMSYDDYENSFMTLKWQNPGYIAMVQMTISSKGKCLLQIGPGHCIEFVASLFKAFHPSSSCTNNIKYIE